MKYRFYYMLLLVTIMTHLILYAPYKLNKNILNGTFIAFFIAAALGCINAYMLIYVYNTYREKDIVEIDRILFGKVLGNVFSFIFGIANIVVSFFMFRGIVEIAARFMLPSTPIWFISAIVLIIAYFNLLQDNRSFLRFVGLITIFILFWFMLQVLLSVKEVKPYFIKGTILHDLKLPNIRAILAAGFYFTGANHLAVFNPEFNMISWKKTCFVYIFIGLSVSMTALYIPVGIWGPYTVKKVLFQTITSADTIQVNLFFIERAMYIMLPLYFLLVTTDFLIFGYVGHGLVKKVISRPRSKLLIKNILAVMYMIFSLEIKNTEQMLRLGSITISIALVYNYLLSVMLFILTRLKNRKRKKEGKTCNGL